MSFSIKNLLNWIINYLRSKPPKGTVRASDVNKLLDKLYEQYQSQRHTNIRRNKDFFIKQRIKFILEELKIWQEFTDQKPPLSKKFDILTADTKFVCRAWPDQFTLNHIILLDKLIVGLLGDNQLRNRTINDVREHYDLLKRVKG